MKKLYWVTVFLLGASVLSAQDALDDLLDEAAPAAVQKGKVELFKKSTKSADMLIKMPKDCDSAGFDIVLNGGTLKLQLERYDEKYKLSIGIHPVPYVYKPPEDEEGNPEAAKNQPAKMDVSMALHGYRISIPKQPNFFYYIRPMPDKYMASSFKRKMLEWEGMPNAFEHRLRIDLIAVGEKLFLYLDGMRAVQIPGGYKIKSLRIQGGSGPQITDAKAYKNQQATPDFEAVNFGNLANAGAMKGAVTSLAPGFQIIDGIPMFVLDGDHSSDLSLVKALKGLNMHDEIDPYMERTAWERYPECQQSMLPAACYYEADILFALDPDPKKDRAFSFRLGKFAPRGRVTGWGYTDVVLPENPADFPSNIKQVGSVKLNDKEIPLYLGRFKADGGKVLDLMHADPAGLKTDYIDYELMGRRCGVGLYVDTSHRPDTEKLSAVNIFGITFRRAAVNLKLKFNQPGNVFYNDETPEMTVVMNPERAGKFALRWTIFDSFKKKQLKQESIPCEFTAAGETKEIKVPLAMADIGHYVLDFDLLENDAATFHHEASFALLGKDTRQATPAESPFGCWWAPRHYATEDPDIWMNIFHKAGIRRTNLNNLIDNNGRLQHADKVQEYQLTCTQLPWYGRSVREAENDPEKWNEEMHKFYDPMVKAFPDAKYVLVLHESTGDNPVPEFFGEKGQPAPEGNNFSNKIVKIVTNAANWWRKNHPEIKLVIGNHHSASFSTAILLRNGFPDELFDYVGIETASQGILPERLDQSNTMGVWYAKQVGRTFGKDLKITGCYEFSARPTRLFDNEVIQAAYYIRDALIGLSIGFETLGLSGFCEAGNWYPQTIWGSGDLCSKGPFFYPKPMLAAYAAMTRALDRIEFNPKSLDTGSCSVYALEFKRKDGKYAYACWVPKGESDIVLNFPQDVKAEWIEFAGKTSEVSGKAITLTASEYPWYVVSPVKADGVKFVKVHSPQPPDDFQITEKLDSMDGLRCLPATACWKRPDLRAMPGKFEIKEVNDEEKGKCIEVKLIKEGEMPELSPEYTRIEFKKPIRLQGTPDELGLWVKGDGGFGQIIFELQDANGQRIRNGGAWQDFACRSFINFTGWYFMTYPVDGAGVKHRRQQSLGGRWTGTPVYPIQLNAIIVALRRKTPNPTAMQDTTAVIRLKDFGGICNPEYQKTTTEAKE